MSSTIKTTQIALGADVATTLYGVTGTGLKIGIISDSFNSTGGAAADMAAGILPSVTVLSDQAGTDEGRAMLELAYSIAPGATYLTADGGSLAANVTALQNAGANIIIDDLSVDGEALYQIGSATDVAIQAAVASGVDYFTSAGNNGNDYYEQGFTPISTTIAGIGTVVANDFGGGSPYLSLTLAAKASTDLQFQFAQPFGSFGTGSNSPTNSLAIYLLDSSGNIVASSTTNDVGGDPTQEITFNNTTANTAYRLVVVQNGGTVPSGQLFKFFLNDDNGTINSPNAGMGSGDLLGHELLPGINVLGSVPYTNTPAFGTSPAVIDPASSVGPGEILFDAQGNALATPIIVGEPQFEAPDGTTTGSANTNFAASPFFGTSAAAPSAGAVSALMLQANAALSTTQITSLLEQSVIPVTVNAPSSGAGLIQARAAVELAAASGGDRWINASGGNWNDATWTTGGPPTMAQAAYVDDNLGAITGNYTVTVNTGGDFAGSIALAAPAGSSATIAIAAGGLLAVGGPNSTNITAGDFLVSDNGTLTISGGVLHVGGSLNVNNGTVNLTSGTISAGNYTENAGQITVGGGGSADLTVTDTTGFDVTGGSVSVLAGSTLTASVLTDSVAPIMVSGKIVDTGALTTGATGTAGNITLNSGAEFDIGGTTDSTGISFAGSAVLEFTSTVADTLNLGLNDIVSGFKTGGDTIDFTGLIYNASDSLGYAPGTSGGPGDLTIFDSNGNGIVQLNFAAADNYTLNSFALSFDAANHLEVVTACYCVGTRISSDRGAVAIEDLRIGDTVTTATGLQKPVRWIGRRSYDGRFIAGNRETLPVCIRAGALADHVPNRDLFVSPLHAMFIDDVLIAAIDLVNGVSIFQIHAASTVEYFHIELAEHDVILAEGAASESFVDDDSRMLFHNAHEYAALYPDAQTKPALYCAPRVTEGYALEAVRHRLAVRAGLRPDRPAEPLRGFLDYVGTDLVEGWAQNPQYPEMPVCLDIVVEGRLVMQALANVYRPGLRAVGMGSGRHAFSVRLPVALTAGQLAGVQVRRSSDQASLPWSRAQQRAA